MKSENSRGYDKIVVKILKLSSQFVISSLTYICNKSLSTGTFPAWLKFSVVNPLYKKGDRINISDFGPISLLIIFKNLQKGYIFKTLSTHITF